jgi:hypothetical protein
MLALFPNRRIIWEKLRRLQNTYSIYMWFWK